MNIQQGFSTRQRGDFYTQVIFALFAHKGISGATIKQSARGARHLSLGLKLHNSTELENVLKLSENIALAANCRNVMAERREGLVVFQFELPTGFWEFYTRNDLNNSEAIGLSEGQERGEKRHQVLFQLDPPHILVAGASQTSGKTTTVKSMLISLMSSYKPEDLNIILCDYHGDFEDFDNESHLVNFEFGSRAKTQDEISIALNWANQEVTKRIESNNRSDKLLVVVIDEAEAVLADEMNLVIAQNISKQAAKFGVHLIISTQKPSQKDLPKILDNLLNRYIGQLDSARTSANISGHSDLQAHKLTGKGDFLHVANADVLRFQVAQATQKDFDNLERGQAKIVEIVQQDIVELPATNPVGRPPLQLDPKWLSRYVYYGPDNITHSMAKELGLSRDYHLLHREAAKDFIKTFYKLKRKYNSLGFLERI